MNGDTVITLDAVNDVIALYDMGEKNTSPWNCIPWRNNNRHRKGINSGRFKINSELVVGEVIMTVNAYEPVTLSEANWQYWTRIRIVNVLAIIYSYANGIMAEGISEEELKSIADAAEETPEEKPGQENNKKSSKKDEPVEEATEEVEKVEE